MDDDEQLSLFEIQYLDLFRLFLLSICDLTDRDFMEQYYEGQKDYVKRLLYYYHTYLFLSSRDGLNQCFVDTLGWVKCLIDSHPELGYPLKRRLMDLFRHYNF